MSLRNAQMVSRTPNGTLIRNTYRQLKTARMPPIKRPINWPESAATWLSPSAFPRSSGGNASVRIAALLEKINAAPTAWISRNTIISMAPASPVSGVRKRRREPRVKIANPILYSLTLPYISERRPKLSRSVAVTIPYPIRIQSRYWNEVSGLMWMPLKMAGREIRIMLPLTAAMNMAIVVFESATHL